VSLWNVNDDATSTLMKEFYRNLSLSLPPREALRRAKISLIHQDNALWRHPHFWAPFVLWLRYPTRPNLLIQNRTSLALPSACGKKSCCSSSS
jgi:hypothetical protein